MTLYFDNVYVDNTSCVVGPYEKNGPLGNLFDKCYDDFYFGEKSVEDAEVKMIEARSSSFPFSSSFSTTSGF